MADLEDIKVALTHDKLEPTVPLAFVKHPLAGAVVYFGGTTREDVVNVEGSFKDNGNSNHKPKAKAVKYLGYESHVPLATRTITNIAKTAKQRFTDAASNQHIQRIYVVHRLGVVPVLEESIIVAVSGAHRLESWKCAMWILEEIKAKAEIWKNEVFEDDSSRWMQNENSNVKR